MELKSRHFQPIKIPKVFSAHKISHSALEAIKEHSVLVVIAKLFLPLFKVITDQSVFSITFENEPKNKYEPLKQTDYIIPKFLKLAYKIVFQLESSNSFLIWI